MIRATRSLRYRLVRRILFIQLAIAGVGLLGLAFGLRLEAEPAEIAANLLLPRAKELVARSQTEGLRVFAEDWVIGDLLRERDVRLYARSGDETLRINMADHDVAALEQALFPVSRGHMMLALGSPIAVAKLAEGRFAAIGAPSFSSMNIVLFLVGLLVGNIVMVLVVPALGLLLALATASRDIRNALAEMGESAARIGPNSGGLSLDLQRAPAEIRPMLGEFNNLLARLDAAGARQGRFLADVAHEMRTPLAILRLRLEAVTDDALRTRLGLDARRLESRLAAMLSLASAQDGAEAGDKADLVDLAREVIADRAPQAFGVGVQLELQTDAPVISAVIRRSLMESALSNLVDNALRYGGGRVLIRVRQPGAIEVTDHGPGVQSSEWDRLKQPFARGVAERPGGLGLGLALVAEIAAVMNGELHLLETPGGGVTARLCSPNGWLEPLSNDA